jgi:hypothetical protein
MKAQPRDSRIGEPNPPYVFDRMFSAVEKVRERLERVCHTLNQAKIAYAIVGGNAVAAWVATRDEDAVRNTRDVDVLLNESDLEAATSALATAGFVRAQSMGVTMFLDGPEGKPSQAIHVIWAGKKVRDDYPVAAPSTDQAHDIEGKKIVELVELVRMKLVSYRDKDKVHVRDMIGVGLIDESWLPSFEPPLAARLQALLDDPDG